MTVTGVAANVFTVTRASEAVNGITTAAAHNSGAAVQLVMTATALTALPLSPVNMVFHGASAYHSTTQASTGVRSLDSEDFDTDGYHDTVTNNSRMTIPTGLGGYYHVRAFIYGMTGNQLCRILKNGAVTRGTNIYSDTGRECTTILNLIAGDYVESYTDNAGTTGHASAIEAQNSLTIVMLGV